MPSSDQLFNNRHSLAHLLAMAILKIDPKAQFGTGPVTDNGFYYDILLSDGITVSDKDFKILEKTMRGFINQKLDFIREEISIEAAKKLFAHQSFKLELIDEIASRGEIITIYRTGDFIDLCEGPHVGNTSEIPANSFKLFRLAGAYWKANEKNQQLLRIAGLAFESKEALDKYIWQQEEAKKRDHRKLAKELKLFTLSDLIGAGLPLMQPNGMIIRKSIEDYLWDLHAGKGYQRVWTPHIAKETLYQTSGHAEKFGDELFRVQGKEDKFILKPMSCPHHMQIFDDNQFSYRDMPVRYFEPATVYRDEKSGQLAGLTRVRAITQDDGHLFCRIDQIGQEVGVIVDIIKDFYTTFDLTSDYWVSLSVRGENRDKFLGDDSVWEAAEKALESAAKENNLPYKRVEGEAAFYGPKLDFMFRDAIGREWQLATIQCDFNLPNRFDLAYINEKGEKERPVVIHRAISGSLERFMGIIIEHFAGNFPLWLAPVQMVIIPISEAHHDYAKKVFKKLQNAGLRVTLRDDNESLGKKIRESKLQKIPYTLVIGAQEMESQTVTLESRDQGKIGALSLQEIIDKLGKEVTAKTILEKR
ncbi:MAG: threonine--tRNA ligase [Candidatus Moranbacteria bacterium]|nr:threonine--tRNA ligase [Candidatus Moranbacteria bacterium]